MSTEGITNAMQGLGVDEKANNDGIKKQESKGKQKTPAKSKRPWTDELQVDLDRIHSVGEECISSDELKELILTKGRGTDGPGFILYDGFEPSGRMHIAQGVFKAMNVNKCTFPGSNGNFVFWVADWFALMNDKMGGDLDKIKTVGHYLIEVWKAAGMDLSHVTFKWASEEITQQADKYWPTMLDVARRFNITRVKKCCQIMGRLEGSLTAAQILYPLMQCTDIFFLKADICQLGVDQRKVNMLAREYCDAAGIKHKPIILSHHMLFGLKAGQEKMSKSDPDSAIFMEDAASDVERKINNAYCPSKPEKSNAAASQQEDAGKESMHLVEDDLKNPCLDYIKNIIFSAPNTTFTAGEKTFAGFEPVKKAFLSGEISEAELKSGLIGSLNLLLEPVRVHFTSDPKAKTLLAQVQQFKKEAAPDATGKGIRRLDLIKADKVPEACHLVFSPLPDANPTLQSATDILLQMRQANGKPCVLFLPDWTACVCNACDADVKAISAYFQILLTSLKSLDPVGMEDVTVIYQSEAILADPSNYWISVINVGRHFRLKDVMGDAMKDSDGAGVVIGRLMKVADVLGVAPASVSLGNDVSAQVECSLVNRFFAEKSGPMIAPAVTTCSGVSLRLQPERESDAHKTENDEYFLLDDPKVHGKSKMKKAFCEPGNSTFCPPIDLACMFTFQLGGSNTASNIIVKRSPDNGGDVEFISEEEITKSFADESLHPGDLKAAASQIMVDTLNRLVNGIKNDGEAARASKTLKAFQKKMSKKK